MSTQCSITAMHLVMCSLSCGKRGLCSRCLVKGTRKASSVAGTGICPALSFFCCSCRAACPSLEASVVWAMSPRDGLEHCRA